MADHAAGLLGRVVELAVGEAVHGGACLARLDGRVVFVRHALPGEFVRARVTHERGGYLRADAVEVLRASSDRVRPPCPFAGPGRCGGCDWQHVGGHAQRQLKAAVVIEQFRRLGGMEIGAGFSGVEELPGGLLGWRSRITFAVDDQGRPGLHHTAAASVEYVDQCMLGVAGVGDSPVLARRWPGLVAIEATRGLDEDAAVIAHEAGPGRQSRGRRPPDRVRVLSGPAMLRRQVLGHPMQVSATSFWQVHPAAADALARAVLEAADPQAGEQVLDLYAGAGALTIALASAVGADGAVLGVDSSAEAVQDAQLNLRTFPSARVLLSRITAASIRELDIRPDVVVLDPPRAGAGAEITRAILDRSPRVVVYVSCEPATLARDVAAARGAGWQMTSLRAFDAFPMTRHVECVAVLRPDSSRGGP